MNACIKWTKSCYQMTAIIDLNDKDINGWTQTLI